MKIKPARGRLAARNTPAQPENMPAPPHPREMRTLVVHHFAWHRIITALALLTLAVAAVV
jgi:hypothetical protein